MITKSYLVLLFGAGKAGIDALVTLRKYSHLQILAFVDNDSQKIGSKLEDIPIIGPQDINESDYDWILITSSFKEHIFKQLVDLGVPQKKIQVFPSHPWDDIDTRFAAFMASLQEEHAAFDQYLFDWSVRNQQYNASFKHVFVASFPKSGSTFLFRTLLNLTDFKRCGLITRGHNIEQEIYLPALIEISQSDTVTRQHPKATEGTLELLKTYSIKPVVLVRNIFDTVVSVRDHFVNHSEVSFLCYVNQHFLEMDENLQYDLIIEMALPWFFNFYVSWFDAWQKEKLSMLWTTYEEIMADKHKAIKKICSFYEIPTTDDEIKTAMDNVKKKETHFNKGVSGRGKIKLSDSQISKIKSYTRFYPWVDFSYIGL